VARSRFGINRLRAEQQQAIEAVLAGQDVLAVLPTGFGKSLIYQVPAVLFDRPTIVVSPLIALMQDQEQALRSKRVPVVRLDSTLKVTERRENLARIEKGGSLVILTTPETLESKDVQPALHAAQPRLLCVDEAHCISEWGHDFRPAYLRIGTERKSLGIEQTLALTATATPHVRDDIAKRLKLDNPEIISGSPHRPNLRLAVYTAPGGYKIDHAGRLLRRLRRPGIVYCSTKQAVDEIYTALRRARIPCARYHGGMKKDERTTEQRKFMRKDWRSVMVATSAFGMGIDKPDIRYIMHYQVPASPEQYVQEAGRAGRDGRPSNCILLYDYKDLDIQEYLQTRSRPSGPQLKRVAKALAVWAADGQAVDAKALALSAQVPMTTARSMCAQLEEGGLVIKERGKGYVAQVEPKLLEAGARDLAKRFETERREDARRLRAMSEYAQTEGCRSVFLLQWFGDEDPQPCGNCDRCLEAGHRQKPQGSERRSRRRRGRRGGARRNKGRPDQPS
jgi:ATP-dependent DNA helicase RecQ